jgi:hypothetical protein
VDGFSHFAGVDWCVDRLDVHKSTMAISSAPADGAKVRYFGDCKKTNESSDKFCGKN